MRLHHFTIGARAAGSAVTLVRSCILVCKAACAIYILENILNMKVLGTLIF